MLKTVYSTQAMMVAPHHLAAQAGRDVLRDGGNAVEAMVAAAAAIAVVYPHMNSIGGDGFWLIHEPGKTPVAIDACGRAAAGATRGFYAGLEAISSRPRYMPIARISLDALSKVAKFPAGPMISPTPGPTLATAVSAPVTR